VPARVNVWAKLAPCVPSLPLNALLAESGVPEVMVCSISSPLFQVTLVPAGITRSVGRNRNVLIATVVSLTGTEGRC
jgi:hypothetical protein